MNRDLMALLLTPDKKIQPIKEADISHAHWLLNNVPSINAKYPYVDAPEDSTGLQEDDGMSYMEAILSDAGELGYLRSRYWGPVATNGQHALFGIDGKREFSPEELEAVYKYYDLPFTEPFHTWDRVNKQDWYGDYSDYLERYDQRKRRSELARFIKDLK